MPLLSFMKRFAHARPYRWVHPAGNYMLFVLSGGVPSVGAWVQINPSVGGTPVSPPSSPSSPPSNATGLTAGLYHLNNVGRCRGHSHLSTMAGRQCCLPWPVSATHCISVQHPVTCWHDPAGLAVQTTCQRQTVVQPWLTSMTLVRPLHSKGRMETALLLCLQPAFCLVKTSVSARSWQLCASSAPGPSIAFHAALCTLTLAA